MTATPRRFSLKRARVCHLYVLYMLVINTFPVNSTSTVVVCSYLDSEDVLTFGPGSTAANPSYLHYIASNPMFIRTFGVHDR